MERVNLATSRLPSVIIRSSLPDTPGVFRPVLLLIKERAVGRWGYIARLVGTTGAGSVVEPDRYASTAAAAARPSAIAQTMSD